MMTVSDSTSCDEEFQKNYNSRKIGQKDGPAFIYMVPNPQQILPCYVIHLKSKHTIADESLPPAIDRNIESFGQTLSKSSHINLIDLVVNSRFEPSTTSVFPIIPYLKQVQINYCLLYKKIKEANTLKIEKQEKKSLIVLGMEVSLILIL